MALVEYSDTESEEQEPTHSHHPDGIRKRKAEPIEDDKAGYNKRKPAPPLPTMFHSLYATNVRTSTTDDPSLHAGRTRQVAHVVGHWPTHVYLEWNPSRSDLAILDEVLAQAGCLPQSARHASDSCVHSFLRSDLGVQLPLHISLSTPLVLETTQKEPFEDSIVAKLRDSRIKAFTIEARRLEWVANHDETRFFLVLKLSRPEGLELSQLLSICNDVARRFDLPQLYQDVVDPDPDTRGQRPRDKTDAMIDHSEAFHISIAWSLIEPNDRVRRQLADTADGRLEHLKVSFSLLKLKIGNAVIDLPLESSLSQSRE